MRAREELLSSAVLNQLPEEERSLDGGGGGGGGGAASSSSAAAAGAGERGGDSAGSAESTLRDGPSLKHHVFFRALRDFDNFGSAGDEVKAGDGYLVSYDEVRDRVLDGSVELR